jgi:ATP-dependent protease ClpP protease subunit
MNRRRVADITQAFRCGKRARRLKPGKIEKAMDRDKFLETDEAKAFGLIDEVFDTRPESGEDGGTGAADVSKA